MLHLEQLAQVMRLESQLRERDRRHFAVLRAARRPGRRRLTSSVRLFLATLFRACGTALQRLALSLETEAPRVEAGPAYR